MSRERGTVREPQVGQSTNGSAVIHVIRNLEVSLERAGQRMTTIVCFSRGAI